jgi:hypothetical protein
MARITIATIKNTLQVAETYDIANAIRNSSPLLAQYTPLASMDNVVQFGAGIQINQTTQNEFLSNLIDRIGLVIVKNASLKNPLAKFKKGSMPFGKTIEEIFTDITVAQKYDPYSAETTLYKRQIPNVKSLFHERNRQEFYTQTIQDDSLKTAFTSWGNFENFLSSIISAIYNSAEVDEYKYMKLLIDNYQSKGYFTVVPVIKPDTETATREFVKKVRATATKMALPMGSREYNSLAVHTRSDMDDLHLLITADLNANLDVDILAKAFNMSHTDFLGHVTVIDNFGSTGLEAVLIDKDFFMVYDNELSMETVRNAKGKYWNHFYHVWQTYSVSRFAPAVAFVSGTVPAVTNVIVDPVIASLRAGDVFDFTAYVRQTDTTSRTVTWTVAGATGTTKQAGTTIDANGLLTVASNQTGELVITATVAGVGVDIDGAGADTTDVIGQAIVTIVS